MHHAQHSLQFQFFQPAAPFIFEIEISLSKYISLSLNPTLSVPFAPEEAEKLQFHATLSEGIQKNTYSLSTQLLSQRLTVG